MGVDVDVRSGPARVVDGGVVATFHGHGLSLSPRVDDGPEGVRARVEFTFESAGGEPAVVAEPLPGGYRLRCVDMDGRGSAEPVLLGELGDDLLFFHFQIQRFGRAIDRFVTWTVFRVAKADVGWRPAGG